MNTDKVDTYMIRLNAFPQKSNITFLWFRECSIVMGFANQPHVSLLPFRSDGDFPEMIEASIELSL